MKLFNFLKKKTKLEKAQEIEQEFNREAINALHTGKWKHTKEENNKRMREAYNLRKEHFNEHKEEIINNITVPSTTKIGDVLKEYLNSSNEVKKQIIQKQINHINHQYKVYEKDYNRENFALGKSVDLQHDGKNLEKAGKSIEALQCYMKSIDYYPTPNNLERCIIIHNKQKKYYCSLFYCELAINNKHIIGKTTKKGRDYYVERKKKLLKKIQK